MLDFIFDCDGNDSFCRFSAVERVPGLYSALLNSADAMDANDITGVRGPKQSCFVDIEKVTRCPLSSRARYGSISLLFLTGCVTYLLNWHVWP